MAAAGSDGPGGAAAGRALQSAMRAASGALEMDGAGRPREAYAEYLKSIALIAQSLQEEAAGAEGSEGVTADTPKMLKLAEQCLERVKSIAAALGKAQAKPAVQERSGSPGPLPRHRRVCSDEGGKLSPFLPPEIFQKLQIAEVQSARKELTPLEEASLQNQKLKAAYEARVARLTPSQALQKTSLTLSLQRQMMENLVIAKAREETSGVTQLQRKMEERRLRLQEAANRRFSSSVALTPEEQEQRALYAAILEYEQDHDWPRQWKAKLKRNPADLSLVSGLFSCLFSFPEHPVPQLLRQLQCAVYSRLYPAVSRGSADASPCSPAGLAFPSLDVGGSLPAEPGGRRLRTSRSLHCMLSVPEHGAAGLRHSLSSTPLAGGSPGTPRVEGGRLEPAEAPQTPRESSFEDLERFLASPEGWAPTEPPRDATLPEQLKGVVRDIHNAVALQNPALPRQAAGPDAAGLRGAQHRGRQGPVPGVPGGSLLPPALGPAHGPLQERAPAPRGSPGPEHGAAPARRPRRLGAVLAPLPRRPRLPRVRLRRGGPAPHPAGDLSPQEAGVHRASPAGHLRVCRGVLRRAGRPEPPLRCHWGGRPAAHPVVRGAADGAAAAAVRVRGAGGVHP
ncbi:VPS9 domain-containing protein 1 isoform X6 [Colius striatus]|uniref:VPS9 domain-containing protein 1 isoform X6 n=1 Tax=Colius striatus TaxID=57412 RepID=UPI002B1E1269|nr:VPS9 domain-containing protein 1 isoform X6 [Colius striatus]